MYEDKAGGFHFLFAVGFWTVRILGIEFLTKKEIQHVPYLRTTPSIIIRNGVIDREESTRYEPDVKFIKAK